MSIQLALYLSTSLPLSFFFHKCATACVCLQRSINLCRFEINACIHNLTCKVFTTFGSLWFFYLLFHFMTIAIRNRCSNESISFVERILSSDWRYRIAWVEYRIYLNGNHSVTIDIAFNCTQFKLKWQTTITDNPKIIRKKSQWERNLILWFIYYQQLLCTFMSMAHYPHWLIEEIIEYRPDILRIYTQSKVFLEYFTSVYWLYFRLSILIQSGFFSVFISHIHTFTCSFHILHCGENID